MFTKEDVKKGSALVEYAGILTDAETAAQREREYAMEGKGCYCVYFNFHGFNMW